MSNLPATTTPAEVLRISPEGLEVANCYLAVQDITKVSAELGIPTDEISEYLGRREIRAYIDNVFMDMGFNNRFKMRQVMDAIIAKKLQEMDETDLGSTKDITEILALSHKMSMDLLDKQIKLETIKQNNIKSQVNVQINDGSSKYESLLQNLMRT